MLHLHGRFSVSYGKIHEPEKMGTLTTTFCSQLLFDCPITVGVAAPIDCGADQSDRKACLKLTSDSHTCTIAMGSTSEVR